MAANPRTWSQISRRDPALVNTEYGRAILVHVLASNAVLDGIGRLRPEHFSDLGLRTLYETPRQRDKTGPPDVESLASWVSRASVLERSNRLHWAACRVGEMALRHKVSESAAGKRLVAAAMVAGLTSFEAARTVDSGFKKSGLRYEP